MNISSEFLFNLAKFSLAFLWIFTGLTSLFFSPELGYELLANVNIMGARAKLLIYSGAFIDIALGIWILSSWKVKLCCSLQFLTIITYSILLTLIDASYWLHPFGPLTKNIPILVLITIIFADNTSTKS